MFDWFGLSLQQGGSGVYIVLLLPAFGIAVLIYRRTRPQVSPKVGSLLVGLRAVSFGLLLLLLAELALGINHREVVRPLLIVLVDTSASMAVVEEGTSRLKKVETALGQEAFQRFLDKAQTMVQGFAEQVIPMDLAELADVAPNGKATDIAKALAESVGQIEDRKNLQAILLFSDGANNLGEDPVGIAADLGVPIYTLGVGKRKAPPDIRIGQTRAPETGYVGRTLKIEADVNSWGFAGRKMEVLLYEGEQEKDRQTVILEDDRKNKVSFQIKPSSSGPHIFRIFIPAQVGETSLDNNEALVFVRVLQERVKVLLLAGGPSPDLAFLSRSLAADSNLVVESKIVQHRDGQFYEGEWPSPAEWAAKDVLVLLDADSVSVSGARGLQIKKWVEEGGGTLLVGGERTYGQWDRKGPLASILPVTLSKDEIWVRKATTLELGPEGRRHPVGRGRDGEMEAATRWRQLPPLPGYARVEKKKEGTGVLFQAQEGERPPLVVVGRAGQGKIIAALSAAFWRLDLLSSGVGGRPQTIRQFWTDAVKWLAIQTPTGRLRASTERHVYRGGENIVFAAQVFDELLRPQIGAVVQVVMGEVDFRLQDEGNGYYRGRWSGLEPGKYPYSVRAFADNELIGEDKGEFVVEQHTLESVDSKARPDQLEELAWASGGRYWPADQWQDLTEHLILQQQVVEENRFWSLWPRSGALLVLIVLLGLEWSIRKRQGML